MRAAAFATPQVRAPTVVICASCGHLGCAADLSDALRSCGQPLRIPQYVRTRCHGLAQPRTHGGIGQLRGSGAAKQEFRRQLTFAADGQGRAAGKVQSLGQPVRSSSFALCSPVEAAAPQAKTTKNCCARRCPRRCRPCGNAPRPRPGSASACGRSRSTRTRIQVRLHAGAQGGGSPVRGGDPPAPRHKGRPPRCRGASSASGCSAVAQRSPAQLTRCAPTAGSTSVARGRDRRRR